MYDFVPFILQICVDGIFFFNNLNFSWKIASKYLDTKIDWFIDEEILRAVYSALSFT